MASTIALLDAFKAKTGITSDNAAAKALGVTRATVSRWRGGQGHPEADSVQRMCSATGEPLAKWLPLIEAERARSPAARQVWLRLAQAAAASVIAYLAVKNLDVQTMSAAALPFLSPVYIMRNGQSRRSKAARRVSLSP